MSDPQACRAARHGRANLATRAAATRAAMLRPAEPQMLPGGMVLVLARERRRREQLAARADAELAVDVAGVRAHRLDADVQLGGDLGVRATLLQPGQDFGLARRQQARAGRRCRGRRAASAAVRARPGGSRSARRGTASSWPGRPRRRTPAAGRIPRSTGARPAAAGACAGCRAVRFRTSAGLRRRAESRITTRGRLARSTIDSCAPETSSATSSSRGSSSISPRKPRASRSSNPPERDSDAVCVRHVGILSAPLNQMGEFRITLDITP